MLRAAIVAVAGRVLYCRGRFGIPNEILNVGGGAERAQPSPCASTAA